MAQIVEAMRCNPGGGDLIHDEMFHSHNPSGRTVALGSTQPLTEMSARSIF